MASRDTIRALRRLQAAIRAPAVPGAEHGRGGRLPDDLATPDLEWLALTAEESDRLDNAVDALERDLSFDHLDRRSSERLLWRLACEAFANRSADHVEPFICANERPPKAVDVFFTVSTPGRARRVPAWRCAVPAYGIDRRASAR